MSSSPPKFQKRRLALLGCIFLILILCVGGFRLFYSYTIISLPEVFGQDTYVGGNKHHFLKTIINPFKEKELHDKISAYVSSQLSEKSSPQTDSRFYWWWHERLGRIPDFRIVSINEDEKICSILVECIDSPDYKCVILLDENKENVIAIFF